MWATSVSTWGGCVLRHSVVTLGGDVVRIRMDQDFGGDQGDLNMLGIYFVDPGEHIEHRTMIVHNHPGVQESCGI